MLQMHDTLSRLYMNHMRMPRQPLVYTGDLWLSRHLIESLGIPYAYQLIE